MHTEKERERGEIGGKGRSVMARSADRGGDKSMLDSILLRFRPIAPKPAGDGSPSVKYSTPENANNGRVKRKYVRVRKKRECNKKKKAPPAGEDLDGDDQYKSVVTLQLLPQRSDGEDLLSGGSWNNLDRTENKQMFNEDPQHFWLNSDKYYTSTTYTTASGESDQLTALMAPARVVESRVTVECVTDTCMDGGGLGLTDADIIKNLEVDTCPGFISDGLNLVKWVNEAYKKMVSQEKDQGHGGGRWEEEFTVRLVMKERFPYNYYFSPAFACIVRLEYSWDERKYSRTVPCDVWRMDGGDFAWRLDVKAALSLSI